MARRPASRLIVAFRHQQRRPLSLTAAEAAARLLDGAASSVTVRRQVLDANQMQKLALTLGRPVLGGIDVSSCPPAPGTPIPPGHHVVYFTPGGTEAQLGADGSDRAFNAPHPFTRRMWAGGRMAWSAALRVGDEVEERTRLVGATAKSSRSAGEMVLVEVEKELRGPAGAAVVDRRSWVFRPEAGAPETAELPAGAAVRGPTTIRDVAADGGSESCHRGTRRQAPKASDYPARQLCWSPVGLFRFSALTFNGHKIHYSDQWSRAVEGHPGIVVHGPLNLICILDYWRDVHGAGGEPAGVDYRAVAPVYAGEAYQIRTEEKGADTVDVVAEKNGVVCMRAVVRGS